MADTPRGARVQGRGGGGGVQGPGVLPPEAAGPHNAQERGHQRERSGVHSPAAPGTRPFCIPGKGEFEKNGSSQ